jgi:hypothetical protein
MRARGSFIATLTGREHSHYEGVTTKMLSDCDRHLQHGLAIVFVEDFADISSTVDPSSAWSDLCPTYDALTTSGMLRP